MRTLILGLGNPILSDDAVGLLVARSVFERIGGDEIDFIEAATSGLQTVQLLARYDRAAIIDSVVDLSCIGKVRRLDIEELERSGLPSSHGVTLGQAVRLAKQVGMHMPDTILVYAISVTDPYTFGERLTPELERAFPCLVQQIESDLSRIWRVA